MAENEARISDGEWDLLEALWTRKRGTAREIADDLRPARGWARTTVKTMLERMDAKGLVKSRRVGNAVEYEPAVEVDEARRSAWRRFLGHAFGGAVAPALAFIATDARLSGRQKAALRRLLDEGAGDE